MKFISSENFDENLEDLLSSKNGEDILKGRFDLEPISLEEKPRRIIDFITSLNEPIGFTYRVLFWEKDSEIRSVLGLKNKNYVLKKTYNDDESPGVIFIDDQMMDEVFLNLLLKTHFNYELALTPSLNVRVQICVSLKESIFLLDIYDDRGFDLYFLNGVE